MNILITSIYYVIIRNYQIASTLSSITTIVIIAFIYKDYLLSKIKTIKKDFRPKSFINFIIAAIIVIILTNVIYKVTGTTSSNESLVIHFFKEQPIIFGLDLVIFGPLEEELIFRLPYKNKYKTISLLISSLIFSAVHIGSLNEIIFIIPYMILALGIGSNYFKTDNIYISFFAHALNNAYNVLLLLW